MTAIFKLPRAHPVDGNGNVYPGATLSFFRVNTDTPLDVYSNASRTSSLGPVVTADGSGRFPTIFLPTEDYDVLLKTAAGVLIYSAEDQPGDDSTTGTSSLGLGRWLEVGAIVFDSSPTTPTGFVRIKRDPQALSKAAHPELNARYSADGYPYGSTSTTFNIPGGAGLFPRIWDDTSTHDPDAATRLDHATGLVQVGNLIGSRQLDAIKNHVHPVVGSTSVDGAHAHTVPMGVQPLDAAGGSNVRSVNQNNTNTSNTGNHDHDINFNSQNNTGGNASETRPGNIALPWIMLVSPNLVAADTQAPFGLPYAFSALTTDTDPTSGFLALNNAAPASANVLYISKTEANGVNVADFLALFDTRGGSSRGTITIYDAAAQSNMIAMEVNAALQDGGAYWKVPYTRLASGGTFAQGAQLGVLVTFAGAAGTNGTNGSNGATGPTGPTGPNTGLDYSWDTGTSDADPGNGDVRVNNAAWGSATFIYISKTGRNAEALGTVLDGLDASNHASNKAQLRLFPVSDRSKVLECHVTGSLQDGTAYWKIPIAVDYASAGMPSGGDVMAIFWAITGNTGAAGSLGSMADGDAANPSLAYALDADLGMFRKGANDMGVSAGGAEVAGFDTSGFRVGTTNAVALHKDGYAVLKEISAPSAPASNHHALYAKSGGKFYKKDSSNVESTVLQSSLRDNVTGGVSATSFSAGTKSTGTFTPDPLDGNIQHATNGGAHTLAPPTNPCTIQLEYTNNGSAGAVTTSGFTKVKGDSLTTTNGHKFLLVIVKTNSYSLLNIIALQ